MFELKILLQQQYFHLLFKFNFELFKLSLNMLTGIINLLQDKVRILFLQSILKLFIEGFFKIRIMNLKQNSKERIYFLATNYVDDTDL